MASQADRSAAPPADPSACDARRHQGADTVQVSSVRPQNDADSIANAAKRFPWPLIRRITGEAGRAKLTKRRGAINRMVPLLAFALPAPSFPDLRGSCDAAGERPP